jgi:hypothetical protein|tara:strand:- start:258 stop:701 length:444 start_codon:yes stop_codon:yes gene_type:complete
MQGKILRSKFTETKLWNKYPVKVLPIRDIFISVPKTETLRGKPFYKLLLEDIERDGLHFPLLVSDPTRTDLRQRKKQYKKRMCDLPEWNDGLDENEIRHLTVWGGSQRIRVAADLGYTHIDCAIIPTLDEARTLQGKMRAPFTQRYY